MASKPFASSISCKILGFQCFDTFQIFLVSQFVQEADEDTLSVQIAVEIEQMDFQLLRAVVADSGVKTKAGNASARTECAICFNDKYAA